MRKYLVFMLMALAPSILMAQAAGGTIKRSTGKNTKIEKTNPKPYKNKAKPSKSTDFYVMFNCNVPSATLYIDGKPEASLTDTHNLKKGSHNILLIADGYETFTQTIVVDESANSFIFTMIKKESPLSPILENLINNMVSIEGGSFIMGKNGNSSSESKSSATIIMESGFRFVESLINQQRNRTSSGSTIPIGDKQTEDDSDIPLDQKPAHQVQLSNFQIGKYEVTQEEWEEVMGKNPSVFKGAKNPVEQITWDECQEFIYKLNTLTGKSFRLPTEAEWEFAARGGNLNQYHKYSGSDEVDEVAWYIDNSNGNTHPVGQKQPNELGLYDMNGNVNEWCQDWYGDYSNDNEKDPSGPAIGDYRVYRGGGWDKYSKNCTPFIRYHGKNSYKGISIGLRLAQ